MTIDYNQGKIAEQYQESKQYPWRWCIETYSLMKQIGDLTDKNVVDMACGEGYFTRLLRQSGAKTVVGFDISERMIDLARNQELQTPLGIDYLIVDARTPHFQKQQVDLAVSAWLLVYAHNRSELELMCEGIASWLRPGGRFVTYTTNPNLYDFKPLPNYRKYGFDIILEDNVYEGAPILWKAYLQDAILEVENYYLPISAYEEAFQKAGFKDFAIYQSELSPDPRATQGYEENYWQDFLNYPPGILMDCIKA